MKFDIEKKIKNWKKSLFIFRGLEPELIDELEDHLRSEIENQRNKGVSEKEAFLISTKKMKNLKDVSNYSKQLRTNTPLLIQNIRFFFKILFRNKSHTWQSTIGLVIGISVCTLAFYYGNYQLSFDAFHEKKDQLFRVRNDVVLVETGEYQSRRATSFYAVSAALKDEIPELQDATHLYNESAIMINELQQHNIDKALYTTSSFFNMFTIPLKWGSVDDFDTPNSVFISSSLSEKMFGGENPVGNSIEYVGLRTAGEFDLVIAGVYESIPQNSYFRNTDVFLSKIILDNHNSPTLQWAPVTIEQVKWRWVDYYTFIELKDEADASKVHEKIQDLYDRNRREFDENAGRKQFVSMEPVSEINLVTGLHNELEAGTNKQVLMLFFGVGALVMIIAWINYVNMSTATSITRSKEIGIKKAVGAYRSQLIKQFLLESITITVIALAFSFAIVFLLFSSISDFFNMKIELGQGDFSFFLTLVGIVLFGSLLSGFYPAIVLSSFKTLDVLKAASKNSRMSVAVRKTLVVFQFAIVAFLLSGSLAVYQQFHFMLNKELGFDIEQKVSVDLPPYIFRTEDFDTKVNRLSSAIMKLPNVYSVSSSSILPGDANGWRHTLTLEGVEQDKLVMFDRMSASSDYLSSMNIELIAGRVFDPSITSDFNESLILNRSGIENLGFTNPEDAINQTASFAVGSETFRIIGVTEDFHYRSMHSLIEPLSIQFDSLSQGSHLIINFEGDASPLISNLEKEFKEVFPETPFKSNHLDHRFAKQYEADVRFQNVFRTITIVAILLSIIGLLALSTHYLNTQRKAISVRKVLGADKLELLKKVLREYIILSGIASLFSIPISIFAVNKWLESFVFRIDLNPIIFAISLILLLLLILFTVAGNTLQLININPAKYLRND